MQGLTIIYTGNGKGKTTAALGLALRAAGHNMRVLFLQFIKSEKLEFGEHKALKLLPLIEVEVFGKGFIDILGDKLSPREHSQGSKKAFNRLLEAMKSKRYQMIICDEIFGALHAYHLAEEDLIQLIEEKPADLHLVFTGRGAPEGIIKMADLVSDVREVKHPFSSGIQAQRGVEF